jgi:hypothetical protein
VKEQRSMVFLCRPEVSETQAKTVDKSTSMHEEQPNRMTRKTVEPYSVAIDQIKEEITRKQGQKVTLS